MSFAGHLKSIDLHNGVTGTPVASSTTLNVEAEKALLRVQLRQKALELDRLRRAAKGSESSATPASRSRDMLMQAADPSECKDTILVDDRGNEPSQSLWIGNTPPGIKTSDLRAKFSKYGSILSTKPLNDCAFVNFAEIQSAIQAWRECHEQELFERGRPLYIRFTNTQAESRRTKDAQFERTSSLHFPAHTTHVTWSQNSQESRTSPDPVDAETAVRWPNGLPPAGPRSHRREISPPPIHRASVRRPPDTYRPQQEILFSTSDAERCSRTSETESPRSIRHESCARNSPVTSRCLSRRSESNVIEEPHSTCSPALPEDASDEYSGIKSSTADQSAMLAEAKAKLIRKASSSLGLSRAVPVHVIPHPSASIEATEQSTILKSPVTTNSDAMHDLEHHLNTPQYPVHERLSAGIDDAGTQYEGMTGAAYEQLDIVSTPLFSASSISSFLPLSNKRLKFDKDDMSSTRSEKSSLSNSSSRDRRCRGCKKLGNEKGLYMLYKCSLCVRRYHSFCGRPRPSQCTDSSRFVCEKCIRRQKIGQDEAQTTTSSAEHKIIQLASPPLSHGNNDSENAHNFSRQDAQTAFDPKTVSAAFNIDSPLSPAAFSMDENQLDHEESSKTILTRPSDTSIGHTKLDISSLRNALAPSSTMNPDPTKYKGVTCPWWYNGDRCWLREDDCLFLHRNTGVFSPDGYSVNRDWTCYYWFHRLDCPDEERGCRNSHYDTGLRTGRDGRVSLKHVTCFWWITRGTCKHEEPVCRFAHADTGLYSRDPSDKRAGMAISTVRPAPTSTHHSLNHREKPNETLTHDRSGSRRHVSQSIPDKNCSIWHQVDGALDDSASQILDRIAEQYLPKSSAAVSDKRDHSQSSEGNVGSLETGPTYEQALLEDPLLLTTLSASTKALETLEQSPDRKLGSDLSPMSRPEPSNAGKNIQASKTPALLPLQIPTFGHLTIERSLGNTDNGMTGSIPTAAKASENDQPDRSTKDPRKLRLVALTQTMTHQDEQAEQSFEAPRPSEPPSFEMRNATKILDGDLDSEQTVDDAAKSSVSSSYRKCKRCHRAVFTGEICRECKINNAGVNRVVSSSGKQAEQHAQKQSSLDSPLLNKDDIERCVENDLKINTSHVENATKSVPQMIPVKRSISTDQLFIANKRPKGCMQFSSTSGQISATSIKANRSIRSRTIDRPKPSQPITIDQLIEQKRLENGKQPRQDLRAPQAAGRFATDGIANQSDKENETPTTEGDYSSLTTTPINELRRPFDSVKGEASLQIPQASASGISNTTRPRGDDAAESPSASHSPESIKVATKSSNPASRTRSSVAVNSEGTLGGSKMHSERSIPPSRSRPRTRCEECARKHKRCLHRVNPQLDDLSVQQPSQIPSIVSSVSSAPSVFDTEEQSTSIVVGLPAAFICEQCKSHQRRCLHGKDGLRLDSFKCFEYLKDPRAKLDILQPTDDWDAIRSAAEAWQTEHLSSSLWHDESSNPSEENLICPSPQQLHGKHTVHEHSQTRLPLGASEQLQVHDDEERRQNDGKSDKSYEVGVDRSLIDHVVTRSVRRTVNSRLKYDYEHISKLKAEGVKFESDEDEDDYSDDEQDALGPATELRSDPLLVAPRSSQNLFEICPELHPHHSKRSLSSSESLRRQPKISRKAEWAQLRESRLNERRELYGNPHWEVSRKQNGVEVSTLIERLVPTAGEEVSRLSIPSVEKVEECVTFQEFIGAPKQPEPCLAMDGALAFRDGAKDIDQTSFARSARGFGRRLTDEDKYPVYEK